MSDAIVVLLTALSIATARPPFDQPEPKVEVIAKPRPEAEASVLTGTASWYDYVPGGAAAGPALRSALGKDWRGRKVSVCEAGAGCISVTLSDWCQCYWKQKRERLIDLDVRSFARLAPTDRGVIKVTVQ